MAECDEESLYIVDSEGKYEHKSVGCHQHGLVENRDQVVPHSDLTGQAIPQSHPRSIQPKPVPSIPDDDINDGNGDQKVPSSDRYSSDLPEPDDDDGEVPVNCPIKPMSDVNLQSLNAAKPVLQKKVLVENILPKLHKSKGGFLNDAERDKVKSGHSNQTKMHILLEILKTKDDAALTTFCNVLEDSHYIEAAEKLRMEIASRGHSKGLEDRPSEIELDKISKIVGGDYQRLLTHLGIPAATIKSFRLSNFGNTHSTCFEGLVFWREGNEPCRPATWLVLLDALEKGAELKEYADRRRSELLSLETSCQTDFGPEATHKILKEKKVAYSLHGVIKKLKAPFFTVVSEFQKQVCSLSDDLYDNVVLLCRTTMAAKAHVSRLPDVPSHRTDFIDHIIKHTTFFDIELIHDVANHLQQPTLTEAVVRYEADLEPLMKTSIAELTDRCEVMPINQDSPKGTYRLVLKFPDDANVKDLFEAKDYLEKVLHIPDAKLMAFDHGCILAYFKITGTPNNLQDLPKKFTKHSSQLQAMGISGAFLIDHWAWGADSDDVRYTNDESDDMEVNDQQGFLGNRKRSHFVSVSGGCAEIVPSKKASHLKESCPTEKESGDRQGTAEEDCCSQPSHPPMPCTEEATSLRSEPVLQIKDLKDDMSHQLEQLQTFKRVPTNHPNTVKFMGGQSMAARKILEGFEPAPSNLVIGKILNRGSYGVIYHGMLGREPVAVKRIHHIFLEPDVQGREHLVRAFKNEYRYLKSLNHPNVVKFMGAFWDEKGPLLIMEMMKENLKEFLKRKRGNLSLRHKLDICYSIAKGLAALHIRSESILHRDLTDRKVLLVEAGTVKIADFGQSKMINKPAQDLMSTQPGAASYMPPEVLEHNPRYTSSNDTFSLGVLMLKITTQQPPQVVTYMPPEVIHDDMEVNDQQGFLGSRKRSHLGSVSGGCADIVPSKKAFHLKDNCPIKKRELEELRVQLERKQEEIRALQERLLKDELAQLEKPTIVGHPWYMLAEEELRYKTPSDSGLYEVASQVHFAEDQRILAKKLGVTLSRLQPIPLFNALKRWRDGGGGEDHPQTWRCLLDALSQTLGVDHYVVRDLEEKATYLTKFSLRLHKTPSDRGLYEVASQVQSAEGQRILAEKLGVTLWREQPNPLFNALKRWRDGGGGKDHPPTWRCLLDAISQTSGVDPHVRVLQGKAKYLTEFSMDGDCRQISSSDHHYLSLSKLLKLRSSGKSSAQTVHRQLARKRRNRLKATSSSAHSLNCHCQKSQRTIRTFHTSYTPSLSSSSTSHTSQISSLTFLIQPQFLTQPQTSSVQSDSTDEVGSTQMDQTDSGFSNDQ